MRFRFVIELRGINPYVLVSAELLVSAERAARLRKGWRKPLPVLVRVNGKPEMP